MTLPEVVSQLQQVKEHLARARSAIRQAVAELGQAERLLRYTLGNIRDQSVYAVPAQAKQHLTDADQAADLTSRKVEEWIAKVLGTGPGNR